MKRYAIALLSLGLVARIACAQDNAVEKEKPGNGAPAAEKDTGKPADAERADYIRFTEEEKTARLETAVRRFTGKDGLEVDLVGVVHIADKSYYQDLDRRLGADYDAVLYELVGDPDTMPKRTRELKAKAEGDPKPAAAAETPADGDAAGADTKGKAKRREKPSGLAAIQHKMAEVLRLDFQLENIDYDRENFIHADMTWDQFADMQDKKGESFFKLFVRSMKAQMDPELADITAQANQISPLIFVKLLLNRDVSDELKVAIGRMFDQSERLMAAIEGKDGTVILTERNKVASAKLGEIIKTGKKRIAIFYGAGHLPGLEELMVKDHGLTAKDTQWLAAWSVQKPEKKNRKPAEPKTEPK